MLLLLLLLLLLNFFLEKHSFNFAQCLKDPLGKVKSLGVKRSAGTCLGIAIPTDINLNQVV